jgi:tRNA-binding EMAP/Myf-like protein
MEIIKFEDFIKNEMRIGRIVSAEKVEGSPKLLKLEVDFGPVTTKVLPIEENKVAEVSENTETVQDAPVAEPAREIRQIISGIAKSYEPEFLVGKEALFIVNLEPREIMGLMSNGMILCATVDGLPVILQPEKEVAPGTQIK